MKRIYDKEFKLNAVKLVKEQQLTLSQASHDLGIGKSTLQRWVKTLEKYPVSQAFPGKGHLHADAAYQRKLEREMEILKRERDILKKALAIFSS